MDFELRICAMIPWTGTTHRDSSWGLRKVYNYSWKILVYSHTYMMWQFLTNICFINKIFKKKTECFEPSQACFVWWPDLTTLMRWPTRYAMASLPFPSSSGCRTAKSSFRTALSWTLDTKGRLNCQNRSSMSVKLWNWDVLCIQWFLKFYGTCWKCPTLRRLWDA